MSGSTGAGEPPVARVEIPDGRGVQVGDHGTQDNKYIQTYIEHQVIRPGPAPSGEVRVVLRWLPARQYPGPPHNPAQIVGSLVSESAG